MSPCLLLFHLTALVMTPPITVTGKVRLTDSDAIPTYATWRQMQTQSEDPNLITLKADGSFEVQLPESDDYMFRFGHPGYEPVTLYARCHWTGKGAFEVVLDRYAPLDPAELSVYSEGTLYPVTLTDGVIEARFPAKTPVVQFEMDHDGTALNLAQPYEVDHMERHGYQVYKTRSENGFATVAVDTKDYPFRSTPMGSHLINVQNFEPDIFETTFRKALKVMPRQAFDAWVDARLTAMTSAVFRAEMAMVVQSVLKARELPIRHDAEPQWVEYLKADRDLIANGHRNWSRFLATHLYGKMDPKAPDAERSKQYVALYEDAIKRGIGKRRRAETLWFLFEHYHDNMGDLPAARRVAARLAADYPYTYENQGIAKMLSGAEMVGKPAPDFVFPAYGGGTRALSDFRGKYVLLDIWSITCPPCITAMPKLKALYDRLDPEKVVFVGICEDRLNPKAVRFVKKTGAAYPQLYPQDVRALRRDYRVSAVPTYVLIDPKGNVVDFNSLDLYEHPEQVLRRVIGDTVFRNVNDPN